jgi:UDP-N-acetylmuramyl pentapeptide phosphotransferase/UDP-N-acetylglucosamine-1-phosphate transferase
LRSLVTIVAAFALSVALTHVFILWLAARRIVALENHRTMHTGAIPTGGGWPLLAAALITAFAIWPADSRHALLVAAAMLLALVSWADDLKSLPAWLRLIVHFGAAALCLAALPEDAMVFRGALPLLLDRLVAGLALVWFLNLYNFMDGIDGIAGVETVTIAAGYVAVTAAAGGAGGAFHGLALAVAGATLGFLVWNWAPARIFLGDVGAVPLGFLMGAMMIDLAVRHSLAAALILPLAFAADATITLMLRIARGEKPWEPHRDHFYQRAARGLGSHAAVAGRVAIVNAALVIIAVLALTAPLPALVLAAAVVAVLLMSLELAARS